MTPGKPAFWKAWFVDQALPLWSDTGYDAAAQGFVECLYLDGAPQLDAPRRVMVQARQIHVFATAALAGWFPDGAELAMRAADSMISRYAIDGGQKGWFFSCSRRGDILEERRDLYAHAFVLLSLASLIRLDAKPVYIQLVQQTLAFLDREMSHPAGGFAEEWPNPVLPRRQNPHMHLLEAFLALQETKACGDFRPRLSAMVGLFDRRFFSSRDHILSEFYEDDWTAQNPDRAFEPGHHFEWIWLLDGVSDPTGLASIERAAPLLQAGLRGIDRQGRVAERVSRGASSPSFRLWGAMEAAKALAIQPNPVTAHCEAADVLAAAWHSFIAPAFPGGWVDRVDEKSRALVDTMPASSLYHISTAVHHLS